ncbi:MAG: extracellular solute-binding protein [Chthoniobacteraceae bacterium]|nr:extracellular solute-binding protein [Chthoniobacteraceae bacterium]
MHRPGASFWVIVALAAVILIPVAMRPRQGGSHSADATLVIVSPHNEAVRYEFDRAFTAAYFAQTGKRVRIDWRTPGGTSEIARYLASAYLGAFRYEWESRLHQPWSAEVEAAFDNPRVAAGEGTAAARARAAFLASRVSCGIDLFFGGGSFDYQQQAAAGRLVPCPELGDPQHFPASLCRFPQTVGGEVYWDPQGRWAGDALSAFGICYNTDALEKAGFAGTPARWSDLANPRLRGKVALADPTQSGSAAKAFEMLIQQQIAEAGGDPAEGWKRAMRLIRRIAGNARYFSDSATRIVWDVESGDAAAGMAIDFYGRFQSEAVRRPDGTSRLGYVTPEGGSSFGVDPIGLLRGAPSPELARAFIAFVLSPEGQKLWNWKVGAPGGPRKYALRRLPVLPDLYAPAYLPLRSDSGVDPFAWAKANPPYHPEWTGPLFRVIGFAVQTMAMDPHEELASAWAALIENGFPPQATALFDDVSALDYATAVQVLKPALASGQKIEATRLARTLGERFRAQYREVGALARAGK